MSEEEIINRLNSIIKEWQEIVNIKDKQEREIEMSMYIEDMPFYEIQGLLDLYNKTRLEKEILEQYIENKRLKEEFGNYLKHNVWIIRKEDKALKELLEEE